MTDHSRWSSGAGSVARPHSRYELATAEIDTRPARRRKLRSAAPAEELDDTGEHRVASGPQVAHVLARRGDGGVAVLAHPVLVPPDRFGQGGFTARRADQG